ncbi:MAG: caspase family protein [Hyphomonadaceae bacterium]|nr:caspase family protein [Hyphomonadaceae bacterium]
MVRIGRLIAFTLLALLSLHPAAHAQGRRVALIIANDTYAGYAPLNNPRADSAVVAAALTRAGFETPVTRLNLGVAETLRALGEFQQRAQGAELAVVYYAGHGVEVGGQNWLVPTDARLAVDADLAFQGVEAAKLIEATAGARARMVVLDACRDNPFLPRMRRTVAVARNGGPGLAAPNQAQTARGTLIVLSAEPGALATDGAPGAPSPFARAFARWLPEPGLELRLAVGRMQDEVWDATGQKQLPHMVSTLSGQNLVLVSAPARVDPETQALRQRVAELEAAGKAAAPVSRPPVISPPVADPPRTQQRQPANAVAEQPSATTYSAVEKGDLIIIPGRGARSYSVETYSWSVTNSRNRHMPDIQVDMHIEGRNKLVFRAGGMTSTGGSWTKGSITLEFSLASNPSFPRKVSRASTVIGGRRDANLQIELSSFSQIASVSLLGPQLLLSTCVEAGVAESSCATSANLIHGEAVGVLGQIIDDKLGRR